MATDPHVRQELLAIYESLAADIAAAAPVCDLSGRCCRFKEYGHRLYVSRPEAELLLEEGLPADAVIDEASCPFQKGNLCTARERRPFGCRVYFCDPKYAGRAEELTERYLSRLKKIHVETNTAWEYAQLHDFLRAFVPQTLPPHTDEVVPESD